MGINLRDVIGDIDTLFTVEEAERIFEAAGYEKKDDVISGYEEIKLSEKMIETQKSNQPDRPLSKSKISGVIIHLKSESTLTPYITDMGQNQLSIRFGNIGGAA